MTTRVFRDDLLVCALLEDAVLISDMLFIDQSKDIYNGKETESWDDTFAAYSKVQPLFKLEETRATSTDFMSNRKRLAVTRIQLLLDKTKPTMTLDLFACNSHESVY